MPRNARIDAPGALHHIIVRGIERRKIFNDDVDRINFLDRLGKVLSETDTRCFAWALIPNHFHLLLRTGTCPLATVMRRLLTGHAMHFNRRHRRSGGWSVIKSFRRANIHFKSDERILGDSDFVESVLRAADESIERKYELKSKGYDIDKLSDRVAEIFSIDPEEIFQPGKQPLKVKARSLFCYWAVRELGFTMADLAPKLNITQPAVSISAQRGEKIASENGYSLMDE